MPLTYIKEIHNSAGAVIYVRNIESPGDTGGPGRGHAIPENQTWIKDLWVPWAVSTHQYASHRIEIEAPGVGTWCIWQCQGADGDKVRASNDGHWYETGHQINDPRVLGDPITSDVGGEHGIAFSGQRIFMYPWPWKPDGTLPWE